MPSREPASDRFSTKGGTPPGEQRGVLTGLVVAELFDHADREPEHAVLLLKPIDGP
jgi:hypothetical protein